MIPAVIEAPPLELGALEWGVVILTTLIIFAIHGPRLLQDFRKWLGLDKEGERR